MIRARLVLPLALGALGSYCARADQLILPASKDNSLFSQGVLSDGAGPTTFVGATNGHGLRRALIAFDLSTIPADASIDSALLSLTVESFHGTQTITLHRLLQDWGEGTSNSGEFGGAGAPATEGDATWDYHHYSIENAPQPWINPGGDFVTTASASGTAAAMVFELNSMQMAADVQMWRSSPASNFGWILVGDENQPGAADRFASREHFKPERVPTLTVNFSLPTPQWNVDADGSWGAAGNWSTNAVPNGPTAVASFLGKITAPRTVTLDGNRLIGNVNFDSPSKYTIAAGTGGSLILSGANGQSKIIVGPNTHEISANVELQAAATTIDVAGDGKLILSGGMTIYDGIVVTMRGGGDVIVGGPQAHQAGAFLEVSTTRLTLNSNAGSPATIERARSANLDVTVSGASGINPSLITLNSSQDLRDLKVAYSDPGPQAVDLNSTATEVHALRIYPDNLAETKAALQGAIQIGRAGGDGIIDSGLHAGAAIGIATLTDAFGDGYILIRPTRVGDLNLDGSVTISDFIDLASNFNSVGGWQDGDLNGDALVTISDFIDLASNFNTSYAGGSLPISAADRTALEQFAASQGVSLVPEPAAFSLFLAAPLLLRRRRRCPE
jgi:hypothetical protein